MRVHTGGDRSSTYGGRFTGAVALEMLHPADTDAEPDIARVHFEDGELELPVGAFVHAPAGERHYHGAAPGASCTWLAMTWGATAWEDAAPERPATA